ncbi:MAG: hypothetical protein ACOC8C_00515 [Chloroflexota bacterium]
MVTKRQLGFLLLALSVISVIGIVMVDSLGAGQWSGFGPLQRLALGLSFLSAAVAAILIALGDRPA